MPSDEPVFPVPTSSIPTFRSLTPLTPVVCDDRAISRMVELLISRSGLSIREIARRLGIYPSTLHQYKSGRRVRPSLIWFVRFASACGAEVTLRWPER